MIMSLLLAVVAPMAPVAVPPAPTANAQPALSPSARATGQAIAQLLNNEAVTIRQMNLAFDRDLPKVMEQDPNFQILEKAYPGIGKAAVEAMKPKLNAYVRQRLPILWTRLGDVYATAMTEAELADTLAFYNTPTGRWLIEQVASGSDMSSIFKQQLADPNKELSASDLRAATVGSALPKLTQTMTPERAREIVRFSTTSAGQKVREIGPKLLQVAAEWSNERTPQADKEIGETVAGAIKDYIAKADAARKGAGT